MTINTKAKGNRIEIKAMKVLEAEGYLVDRARRTLIKMGGRFISSTYDFFGCADLIAVSNDNVLFVQVTCSTNLKKRVEQFSVFNKYPSIPVRLELWQWRPKKRTFKVYYYVIKEKKFIFEKFLEKKNDKKRIQ